MQHLPYLEEWKSAFYSGNTALQIYSTKKETLLHTQAEGGG